MNQPRDVWDDKPVVFGEFSLRDGDYVSEGFDISNTEGSYRILAFSMRWAEPNGGRVFADSEQIWALAYRHRVTMARLAAKAAYANGMLSVDPDAPELAEPHTNGHDTTAAAPSS